MSKIDTAIHQMQSIDTLAKQDRWMNRLHPSVKLSLTILYIILTVSFHKYDLSGLLGMILYPMLLFQIGEVSFREALLRLRIILPLVCVIGLANPFVDRAPLFTVGGIAISGGIVSMVTLMLKGVLSVLASYLLIVTTSIEKICYALRRWHVPKLLVTEILLIYRYISVLLTEVGRVTQAYHLRAPGQKGIHYRAWGSLTGQILLRSMDRAERVYQSMCLRGYHGEFYLREKQGIRRTDLLWLLIWGAVLILLRFVPVMHLIGNLFLYYYSQSI